MTEEQQLDESLSVYRQLLAPPDTAAELAKRGVELTACGNSIGSIDYFNQALQRDPAYAIGYFNRGTAFNTLGRFVDALADFDQAIALGLDVAEVHHNRGIALFDLNRQQDALLGFERAIELANDETAAVILNTQGFTLQTLGRFEEARISYRRALKLKPDLDMARLNLGITCLSMGLWREGWEGYESRWGGAHEAALGRYQRLPSPLPQWNGEAVGPGDGLLVFAEQGLGDMLQFARYLTLAAARFNRLSLVSPPQLVRLLRASFAGQVEVLEVLPADQKAWQWHCPLMSLPRAFNATLETVPANVPYLSAMPESVSRWRDRLETIAGGRTTVGLVWAGDRTLKMDAERSIELRRLVPLLKTKSIVPVSLQKGEAANQIAEVPEASLMVDWTGELGDFADTAALVSALDLVISVDTAVAHLAGALGKPVWLLNRFESEWRWMRGREDSPWYPSMRIFNQTTAGDWEEVLSRVQAALPL